MDAFMVTCSGCKATGRVDGPVERGTAAFEVMHPPACGPKNILPKWAACWSCDGSLKFSRLKAVVDASIPCDWRCTNARGACCTCSCGGENHGRDVVQRPRA